MWKRRERVLTTGIAVAWIAWFFVAVGIATWLGVEPGRFHLWVPSLIFAVPIFALIVLPEVIHRIKHGPQKPGRHSRTPID